MDPGSRAPHATIAVSLFVAMLWTAACGVAQAQVPEYQLKAEFLERFTRFIEWPEPASAGADSATPFVIGVYGSNPFGRYLADLTAVRSIKGKAVKVREVKEVAEIDGCHMLFISAAARRALEAILARTAGKPVLTVGDSEGFAERGVLINFYSLDNTIGFEVNEPAVRRSGLKVSSRLLKLARIVDQEAQK
jgi:hypothetical protein